MLYEIRAITRYEHVWIHTETLHHLFSQLTTSRLLTQHQFENWFNNVHANPCFTLFGVIESKHKDPKLVGVGTLWIQPKYYRDNGKSGHIEDIIIDKEHRKKGLGKSLVKYITDYAKGKGCYKAQLHCAPEKQSFYEDIGFKNNSKSMCQYYNS